MTDMSSEMNPATVGQLKAIIERIERLEEEKKALSEDIRDVYAEAKANGFDGKVLRRIVSIRKQDANERREMEELVDLYMGALGMLVDTPLGQAAMRSAGILDRREPAMARSAKPVKVIDRIDRDGNRLVVTMSPDMAAALAKSDIPPHDAETGEIIEENLPETATEQRVTSFTQHEVQIPPLDQATVRNPGVTDGETSTNSEIAGASTANNSGQMNRLPSGSVGREECMTAQLGPSTCETPTGAKSGSAMETGATHSRPIAVKPASHWRPHCQRPDACGSSGLAHCFSCSKALPEVSAHG